MAMNFSMLQTDVLPSAAGGGRSEGANSCRNTAVTERTTARDGNADVVKGLLIKASIRLNIEARHIVNDV